MIVKREYIPFRELILHRDKAGKLFTKLCKKAYPADMWEEAYIHLLDYALYQRDMGWAFHGIGDLIDGFRMLDEEEPYDTGYEIRDAQTADILYCDEKEMTLLLRTGESDEKNIVGIIKVPISAINKNPDTLW